MIVAVTADHLAKGEALSETDCPVAIAVRDATGRKNVSVEPIGIVVNMVVCRVPPLVDAAINLIDDGRADEVQPFEFELLPVGG